MRGTAQTVAETGTIPRKPAVSEQSLVEAMAEDVADAGYKVTEHTVKENHERGETTLTVKFVRANPDQPQLPGISNGSGDGDGDES
jgi:hypothetical protein